MATGRLPDPNSAPVTAKGDLYTYSTVPAKLAVGNNGETLVADSSATTGLRWQGNFAAGKNAIINGDFRIWQRGGGNFTSFGAYTSDRWQMGGDGGSSTVSRQSFTPGTAPVAGYESEFFLRMVTTVSGSLNLYLIQPVEDVRTFAGQTVTLSYWAKCSSGTVSSQPLFSQVFGSGGSASVVTQPSGITITTSWQRFTHTVAIPSISGKTIGTSSYLQVQPLRFAQSATVDIWGVQLEAGNTATAFQTATGTLAGELAACQRYYWRSTTSTSGSHGIGATQSTTSAIIGVHLPVTMRVVPTSIDYANLRLVNYGVAAYTITSITLSSTETTQNFLNMDCAGATGMTANRPVFLYGTGSNGYLGASAEL